MFRLLYVLLAAGTAHTNSIVETVLASKELPAYSTQAGKVYRWSGAVRATATNSTDTLTVVGRIGTTALAGTSIFTTGAVDAADNDVVTWDVTITCRSATSIVVHGSATILGAEGTVTRRAVFEVISVTNTASIYLGVTADWSVASASNSCQAEAFEVSELV